MAKKVGVILSGCGHLDGAEIRESVLALLALDRAGAEVIIAAPQKKQYHVINHKNGDELEGERDVFIEASRIARGKIIPLEKINCDELDALVLPGGFGVAKNLSSFAFEGPNATLDEQFKTILETMYAAKKPIGAICISPAVICLSLGAKGVEVTVGDDPAVAEAIEALGAKHVVCSVDSFHCDANNKVVTTPAYMYGDAKVSDVAKGIEGCVNKTLDLID